MHNGSRAEWSYNYSLPARAAAIVATGIAAVSLAGRSAAAIEGSPASHQPLPTLGPVKAPAIKNQDKNRDWAFHSDRYDLLPTDYADTVSGPNSFWNNEVVIQGFNVKINSSAIWDHETNDELTQISLINQAADRRHRVRSREVLAGLEAPPRVNDAVKDIYPDDQQDPILGVGTPTVQQIKEGVDYLSDGLQAIKKEELIIEKDRVTKAGQLIPLEKQTIPIDFQDNVHCAGVAEKVVSEVKLSPAYRQRACRYLLKVTGLIPNNFTIFFDKVSSELYQDDMEDAQNNDIVYSLPFTKDLYGHSPEYGTFLHEALHATYRSLPPSNKVRRLIAQKYVDVKEAMTYRMPNWGEEYMGYPVDRNEPVWAAITEATYERSTLHYKFSDAGHPWDEPTEMTSSTAAVLATYPREFIGRYHALRHDYQKEAVKGAVEATFSLISLALGPDNISEAIPEYELIRRRLGITGNSL